MTKLEKATVKAVRDFYMKMNPRTKIDKIRHIHPRCYVVAKPASMCLVVAYPAVDCEPHIKKLARQSGLSQTVHIFDDSLTVGDWCSVAYVASIKSGEPVAVRCVE